MTQAAFDDTIGAIYRAALDPERWPGALEHVADFVGGIGAMVVCNDIRNARASIVVGRLRQDLSDLYVERHYANPWTMAFAQRRRSGKALVASSLVDRASIDRSELHADVLAPQKVADMLALTHAPLSPDGGTGGFGVTLNARQAGDGAMAAERLTRLGPHLSHAFDLSLEVARHRDDAIRLGALLDALPSAAMLLDHRGRVTRANRAAEALLHAGDGLTAGAGASLGALLPSEDRQLRRAVAATLALRAGDPAAAAEQVVKIHRRTGGAALLVILTPLPPASFRFSDVAQAQADLLVRVIDPMLSRYDRNGLLSDVYGLTAAEVRVAILVAFGQTAPEVAARLDISANTVRTHLARIFDKTGMHSQVALTRLLNAIGAAPSYRSPGAAEI